jgi:hypothetical protein
MADLTPVGLSKDGRKLVLISDRGVEFTVPVDTRLRAALQGDQARLGQLEMTMESTLRPKDIQARIRAGESAEAVATAAQTTLERIMPFAAPVLAERAHVAESAQASSVRRASGEASGSARSLADSALGYLREVGLHDDDVAWDAWRREDGRWSVLAELTVDGRAQKAEFTYDLRGRYVVADNEAARMLTGEARPAGAAPERSGQRRLAAVPIAQDELPLGDDAIELVRDPTADHADADWIVDASTAPERAEGADEVADEVAEERAEEAQESTVEVKTARKKTRSAVPSWDEIMFGGGRTE